MDHSTFTKNLRLVFKIFTFLDTDKRQLHKTFFILRALATFFIFLSTIDCFFASDEVEKENYFSKIHDITILFIIILSEVVLVLKKDEICSLIEFITKPLELSEPSADKLKLIEDCNKETYFLAKSMAVMVSMVVINWSPLNFMFGCPRPAEDLCVHVIIGWLRWRVELDHYIIYLRLCLTLLITKLIVKTDMFCMTFVLAIVKIKYQLRLLCKDVYAIRQVVDETTIQVLDDFPTTTLNKDELFMRIESISGFNRSGENTSERLENLERRMNLIIDLQNYFVKKEINNQVKKYFKVVVPQHVEIIENIKLLDRSFRLFFMVYLYGAVFVSALNVPKIHTGEDLLSSEYLHRIAEVIIIMVFLATLNYFGQILIDELEELRQALYWCDWVDAPLSAKRGLLIMQTVANAPPRLTVGGTLSLSLETFTDIARALFSYINIIQSLK